MMRRRGGGPVVALAVLVALLAGCSAPTPEPTATVGAAVRDELLEMFAEDQAERTGESAANGDRERTERLKEMIDELGGWPTISLVGEDGEDAAWLIAQHSDHDPDFQAEALELLRDAVADGDASPGNLAYLEDRVAVAAGDDQVYGTQIGCGADGPEPATPIRDLDTVDARRAEAGLEPLEDYFAELTDVCAAG